MKMRILTVAASVVCAVALAGCSGSGNEMDVDTPSRNQEPSEMQGGAVSGVAEWVAGLASGKAYECEYSTNDGDGMPGTVRMIMDRDRYRTETETPDGSFVSVFDGETSYSWTVGRREGMKMSRGCMENIGAEMPEGDDDTVEEESFRTPEEALDMIPDISCREISVPDFSVPGDVEFADQCEMLRTQMEMMKQYRDQMPDMPAGMPEDAAGLMRGMRE